MTHGIPPAPKPVRTGDTYGRPPQKHKVYAQLDLEVTTTDLTEVESRLSKILGFIRELGFRVREVHTKDLDWF